MINYIEAKEESERLSRVISRAVEVKAIDCPCDYNKNCGVCGGSGTHYEPVYAFCDHLVPDGRDLECEENFCAERERVAAIVEADPPPDSPQVKSLRENESERIESEAA